ncbi:MAG: hypothetical protein ABSF38_04450 [Verrucomicrobiota bacterium]|jgi:hypothetical protein
MSKKTVIFVETYAGSRNPKASGVAKRAGRFKSFFRRFDPHIYAPEDDLLKSIGGASVRTENKSKAVN